MSITHEPDRVTGAGGVPEKCNVGSCVTRVYHSTVIL